jgi:hypothetical protein
MTRKPWNSNWGYPNHAYPAVATAFELQVRQLQLTMEMYASSAALRIWCEQNKNRCYIPEWLLAEWRMSVNAHSAV